MKYLLQLFFWRLLAIISLLLGVIGMLLPVVPTVPFLIVSAWAGGKGWPALERWLLAQPHLGPAIIQWRLYGIVPKRAKYLAIGMMLLSAIMLQFTTLMLWLKLTVPLIMLIVAVWLWLRPEQKPQEKTDD
jgi:uncharacterized protein